MPLSYAGTSLLLETPEVESYLAQYHSLDRLVEQSPGGASSVGLDPFQTPGSQTGSSPRIGVLYWPRDCSRCATFHAVVSSTKLNEIRAVVDTGTYQNLVLSDGVNDAVTVSMRILPPRPLFQIADTEQLYLLSLVDYRYDLLHNRSGDVTAASTWEDLYDNLADSLSATLTASSVDADYGSPSARWTAVYRKPLPPVLDAAAATIGQRVVADFDGALRTVNWEDALAESDTQYELYRKCGGGKVQQADIRRAVPASVRTVFGVDGAAPHTVTNTLTSLSITGYSTAAGITDGVQTVHADLVSDGTNDTACAAYAAAAAKDWYGWQLCDPDVTFAGIVPWEPTGAEDHIEWTYSLTGPGPRLTTRVQRGPWWGFPAGDPEDLNGTDGDAGDGEINGCAWAPGLTAADCLKLVVVSQGGTCSNIDAEQVIYLESPDGVTWTGLTNFVHDAGQGPAVFVLGAQFPTLTLDAVPGMMPTCSGLGIDYAFGGIALCGGTSVPCENGFVVRITCTCCAVEGWDGPGWYCVENESFVCEPLELLDADRCADIVICSGPYATEAAALVGCPPPVVVTCCVEPVPRALYAHASAGLSTAECACAVGLSVPISYDAGLGYWTGTAACSDGGCSKTYTVRLECLSGPTPWRVTVTGTSACGDCTNGGGSVFLDMAATCSPFSIGTMNLTPWLGCTAFACDLNWIINRTP